MKVVDCSFVHQSRVYQYRHGFLETGNSMRPIRIPWALIPPQLRTLIVQAQIQSIQVLSCNTKR